MPSLPGIASSGSMMPKVANELPWSQLNENEKTERTHEIVRLLLNQIEILKTQLNKTTNNFNQHSHDKDGDTVIARKLKNGELEEQREYPINPSNALPGMSPMLSNDPDAYF